MKNRIADLGNELQIQQAKLSFALDEVSELFIKNDTDSMAKFKSKIREIQYLKDTYDSMMVQYKTLTIYQSRQ